MRTIYPGDYSYVAEPVKNSFIQPSLRILLEYGLPQNAVETFRHVLESSKLNIDSQIYLPSDLSTFVCGCSTVKSESPRRNEV